MKGQPILTPTANDASGVAASGVQVDVPVSGTDASGGGAVTSKRVGGPVNGSGGLVTLANGTTVMRYQSRRDFAGVEEIRFNECNRSSHGGAFGRQFVESWESKKGSGSTESLPFCFSEIVAP